MPAREGGAHVARPLRRQVALRPHHGPPGHATAGEDRGQDQRYAAPQSGMLSEEVHVAPHAASSGCWENLAGVRHVVVKGERRGQLA